MTRIPGLRRRAILEYIRNCTPVTLLFAAAFYYQLKLSLGCAKADFVGDVFALSAFYVLWALAFLSNVTLFIDQYVSSSHKFNRASIRLHRRRVNYPAYVRALVCYVGRKNRVVSFEIGLLQLIVNGAIFAALKAVNNSVLALLPTLLKQCATT